MPEQAPTREIFLHLPAWMQAVFYVLGFAAIACVPAGEQHLLLRHADCPEVLFGPFTVGVGLDRLELRPTLTRGVACAAA